MTARTHIFLIASVLAASAAAAQPADTSSADAEPAFALSSSQVYTTRDDPSFNLTFRRLPQLDFRVYRVRDPFTFFSSLRDPHQLGSEDRPVPQERSWIERIADWKAGQRRSIRGFFRGQVSSDYRITRRAAQDRQEIAQRVVLNQTTFAQVPLLNPDQLVTAWRELLPNYRDTQYRRVPLDVQQPGIYLVEAVSGLLRAYTIVVVSDIGVVTKLSPGQLLMFAADRFSGEPKTGCQVRVLASQRTVADGQTGADGVVTVALSEDKPEDIVGVVRCGDQSAVASPGGWYASEPQRQLVGHVYTDKPIYRPGHRVHVKGVLRWRDKDALLPFDRPNAEMSISDLNDKVVFRQSLTVDEFGAVNASFPMPATAALGYYGIRIAVGDQQANGGFEVQEYRRPEFEVIVTPAARFVLQGNEAVASVQARYYFGQPVANARVRYVVNQQAYYSPLRWDDGAEGEGGGYFYGGDQRVEGELRLDAQGRGEIRVPLQEDENGHDYSVRIEAQVTDASSREVSGSTIVHATYGPFLLSAQTSGYIFRPSQAVPVTLRALDYLGNPQGGIAVVARLERLTYPDGRYSRPTVTEVSRGTATTLADGTASTTVTLPADAGSYRVRVVASSNDREIRGDTWIWVPGAAEAQEFDEGDRYLELLSDKRTYAPGETARVIIRGEPVSGPVLVTKEGQQVIWHEVMRPAASDPLDVPIAAGDVGDVYVNVVFMREGRLYRAERRLSVPAADRALQITLTADRPTAKPREPGVFTLKVVDATGAPARAQVSLGVIDEAVYAIRPDDTPDAIRTFYRREYSRVGTEFSRDYYFTGFSGTERLQLAGRRRRPFTLADFKGDKEGRPQVRKEFPDAIYWIGDLVTGPDGQAKVSITYPDALTTWRLTARAVTRDTKAGAAVARTTTTKDLIVRIITPRFLTEGDQVVLPTIAHNYLPDAKDVNVSLAATGLEPSADASAAPPQTSGTIASGGERRADWRFRASAAGTATVTASARTDADADAVELSVPVLPYGLRREAGTSGSILGASEATSDVTIPASANPASRTVTVSLAPSMAGSLLGALDFLTDFPYGCTEQTLSSFIPNVVVTRAMTQLKLAPTERLSLLDRQVADGLRRLYDFQHEDGGWGWWKTDENHPFMTAYALYGLTEARAAGYRVDDDRLLNGARALAAMYADYPRAEPDLKAYMAYVLRRAMPEGEEIHFRNLADRGSDWRRYAHAAARDELWEARSRMSAYGRALLLLTLDEVKDARGDALAQTLAAEAETRGELSWWSLDRDPLLFDLADTSVEVTATALQALARRDPSNPLLDRGVRWLMLNRRGGYWFSTKQTAVALYGLVEVLRARNETAQPFSVDVFVNGTLAGSHNFTAGSITAPDPIVISAPAREGSNAVRLVKKGAGTLYWSARAAYYDTANAESRTGSRQLAITRRYARLEPVQMKDRIVYRESPFDGRMNPGDVLTVRLTIAGSSDWRYLMIEDPLPAGVEAVQDTTAYPMERQDRWRWWWGSQVEYRDNRTVFFQEQFVDGRAEFIYLVKAISSGEFRAVPAQVSPMYVPDVTASSEPQTVTVAVVAEGSR